MIVDLAGSLNNDDRTGIADVVIPGYTFVTGGTGLVGSHLIQALVSEGKKVKALYRKTIPAIAEANRVEWVKGDILDINVLEDAFEGVEYVYHCAAVVSFNPGEKEEMFAINIEGTANVVNAAIGAGVKKLCYVSSVAALGKPLKGEEVTENVYWSEETNKSNYSKSKYYGEVEVWRGIGEGLNAVIVNPAIILGAGNWNDSSTKIFKTAFNEFPWYTNGMTGFVDVIDVVKSMICLMDSSVSSQRFIISGENKSYREIFSTIAREFDKKPPQKKVSAFLAGVVWRIEAMKNAFTNKKPLLTRETAEAAQEVIKYNNEKLVEFFPSFRYTPINETIKRVCIQLKEQNSL